MAIIKINLAPLQETENRYWWAPDAICATIIILVLLELSSLHTNIMVEETNKINSETTELSQKLAGMKADLAAFEAAKKKIDDLESMYDSIAKITVSKIEKYRTVILSEHIQNLKPEGVWTEGIKIGSIASKEESKAPAASNQPSKDITIVGFALDNIILSEFITQLKATATQERDPADLRSQIYFNKVDLTYASSIQQLEVPGKESNLNVMKFELRVTWGEQVPVEKKSNNMSKIIQKFKKSSVI